MPFNTINFIQGVVTLVEIEKQHIAWMLHHTQHNGNRNYPLPWWYFGGNSAHPLENPNYMTNIVENILIITIVFTLGSYLT